MKLTVRISLILFLCIIFSRIVYLFVSPIAYMYIDRKEKQYISELLTGNVTSQAWEKNITAPLSNAFYDELSSSQKLKLKQTTNDLKNKEPMINLIQRSIFHIRYKLIAWWIILGCVTIFTLKGHASIPYVVMLLPLILIWIKPDDDQLIRETIRSLYQKPNDSNWYVMQKYVIGSHLGIFSTKNIDNFDYLFQKAFYKQQYLRVISKFSTPTDYIQFEVLSMYYCFYLCILTMFFEDYFNEKKSIV